MIILIAFLGVSCAALGQSRDENWKRCRGSDPEQSIAACSTIIQSGQQTDANLSKAFDSRGLAYMHKREFDRAIQDYDQALRLNSRSATATYNRALIYRLKGDYARSISGYDDALLLTPTDPDSFFGRGLSCFYQGDYDRAVQDYDQALRINPSLAYVFRARSSAYLHKGEYLRAVADYARWRGVFGITRMCLGLVALVVGLGELRKGSGQNVQFRRFMGWVFAAESLQYTEATVRSIQNSIHQHPGFAVLVAQVLALLVACSSAAAWWTVWKRKSSARGFAIAASLMQVLIFVRQFIPPSQPAGDYHATALIVGTFGLLAFLREDWPPTRLNQEEKSHLTSLFADQNTDYKAAKQVD